jgi:hypothetical protein
VDFLLASVCVKYHLRSIVISQQVRGEHPE